MVTHLMRDHRVKLQQVLALVDRYTKQSPRHDADDGREHGAVILWHRARDDGDFNAHA